MVRMMVMVLVVMVLVVMLMLVCACIRAYMYVRACVCMSVRHKPVLLSLFGSLPRQQLRVPVLVIVHKARAQPIPVGPLPALTDGLQVGGGSVAVLEVGPAL